MVSSFHGQNKITTKFNFIMNNWNTFACILRVFRNYTQHHHNNSKCKFCTITPVNLTPGQRFFIVLAGNKQCDQSELLVNFILFCCSNSLSPTSYPNLD